MAILSLILVYGQYEPELFPGLIYRMKVPKIVLLIFVSGKIVITGAKVISHSLFTFCDNRTKNSCFVSLQSLALLPPDKNPEITHYQMREETYRAFENIYPVLTEFRKIQQQYVTHPSTFLIFLSNGCFFDLYFHEPNCCVYLLQGQGFVPCRTSCAVLAPWSC